MIVYTPIFYCAEPKLAFKGKLTWKVADTLQYGLYARFQLILQKYPDSNLIIPLHPNVLKVNKYQDKTTIFTLLFDEAPPTRLNSSYHQPSWSVDLLQSH